MSDDEFREVLVWFMCSDPWPGGDQECVRAWLNREARERGFNDWVEAFHYG